MGFPLGSVLRFSQTLESCSPSEVAVASSSLVLYGYSAGFSFSTARY